MGLQLLMYLVVAILVGGSAISVGLVVLSPFMLMYLSRKEIERRLPKPFGQSIRHGGGRVLLTVLAVLLSLGLLEMIGWFLVLLGHAVYHA